MLRTLTCSFPKSSLSSGWNVRAVSYLSNPLWLRDACDCSRCVDPSTRQKLFQTSDLPLDIGISLSSETKETIEVVWKNDLLSSGTEHVSKYKKSLLRNYLGNPKKAPDDPRYQKPQPTIQLWDGATMAQDLWSIDYSYQDRENAVLDALVRLAQHGLVLITGVPLREDAVETIASRIGHLRETFYGRTWDVRSIPEARNVAYTNQFLGFHMDLLYMKDPPGLQLLHCLKNTCPGGASMFADAFKAAQAIKDTSIDHYSTLSSYPQTFHYENAGQYYQQTRPIVMEDQSGAIESINWSPPFQGPFEVRISSPSKFHDYVRAAKAFSSHVEAPENVYEYRMQEGDCFIFNNRRVLHARRAFDTASGERWLKGAYVDTDVFKSRLKVLSDKLKE